MKELQIPTRRVSVDVYTIRAEHWRGYMFLLEAPCQSGGPEDVGELLNDEREFVPFVTSDAEHASMALNKAHLARVHIDLDRPDDDDLSKSVHPGDGHVRRLDLVDGSRIVGEIAVDTPPQSSRLLDKLNVPARFVPVWTEGGLDFVQREQIVRAE